MDSQLLRRSLFAGNAPGSANSIYNLLPRANHPGEPTIIYTNSDIGTNSQGVSSQGTLLYGIGNRHADATLYPFNGDLSKLGDPTLKVPVTGSVSWLLGGGTMRFSPDGKRLLAVGISSRELIIHSLVSNTHQTITPRLKQLTRVEWAPTRCSASSFWE